MNSKFKLSHDIEILYPDLADDEWESDRRPLKTLADTRLETDAFDLAAIPIEATREGQ